MKDSQSKGGCGATPLILMMLPFFGVWVGWELCDIYLGSGWWVIAFFVGLSVLMVVVVSLVMRRSKN